MPIDPPVSGAAVFFLGLSLGLTACAATCMPFIGTWVFARAEAQGGAWRDTFSFLGGRLLAYGGLGAIAASAGSWFVTWLGAGIGNLAIALSAILAAAALLWPSSAASTCGMRRHTTGLSPFALGVALTLIPCTPLATLLAAAAASGSAVHGLVVGLQFGSGALITPMLVLIPALAGFGRHLRLQRNWLVPWMRCGGALVLLTLANVRLAAADALLFPLSILLFGLVVAWAHYRRRQAAPRQQPSVHIAIV